MTEEKKGVDNIQIFDEEGYCLVLVNPKIFTIDVVYSASYSFLERAYIVLDGDPAEGITIRLRPKSGMEDDSLEKLGRDFNDELLKYATYKDYSLKNSNIRWLIVEKALQTNCQCETAPGESTEGLKEDPLNIIKQWEESHKDDAGANESFEDDPLGISKPWQDTTPEDKGKKQPED